MFNHFRSKILSLELIPSSGGVFEVNVNGEKIYSKKETGEFPDHDLIIQHLEKLMA
ncbi:SelT/SelW/SelH family protein [Fictibacillus sp. Sa2CUA10]|uniref:SelT/SelW/SelH family protein n=1 Tax=Fictibacillus norfolkensis TaxID=2762233 RepID=A0ABR8SLB4_9BACL|nr:SelT/SelW/SelH family protein [Fictibacillus norfolkensis]MBH0167852.1 Rdx family protein [Fictibacillus sp. 18YEL24]